MEDGRVREGGRDGGREEGGREGEEGGRKGGRVMNTCNMLADELVSTSSAVVNCS
jgi:hypothetical protein